MDYSKYLNSSIQSLRPSGIRKFFDIANEMEDVISLSIGEPDFQTPWHIRDEGIRSLEKGKTWYSPNRGFAELLKEITRYYKRRFGITYDPQKQTLVTVGGSEAIDLAFRTLVEEGDEVIIPQPAFVCYNPLCVMAGGVPVICSKIRGNVDLIDDGKGGILCDVNSADDYANGIKTLVDNKKLREKYARYSDNKIKSFSLTVVDKKMREIYSKQPLLKLMTMN